MRCESQSGFASTIFETAVVVFSVMGGTVQAQWECARQGQFEAAHSGIGVPLLSSSAP